jgi:cation diffusion facilitator CzcD-associated flavoprotein CzcO
MQYQWAVIGAGPSGIAAVGKLLDHGIPAREIAWIDPCFTVGDFGTLWRNVPSNTKVNLFVKFLQSCLSFRYHKCPHHFELHTIPSDQTCPLAFMADPLQWVTEQLKTDVTVIQDIAEHLSLNQRTWHIQLKHSKIDATHVILAVGAKAKHLTFPALDIVPLSDAMDHERIKQHIHPHQTIAVFGSSHSAILVLRNLIENGANKIINFYRSPLRYAIDLNDWTLFDNTGLKGLTADWARHHINGTLPSNLERIYSNKQNIDDYLPQCHKVIYAVGFERRSLPIIQDIDPNHYIEQIGIIAPGLFGVGIAYPEEKMNPVGIVEHRVGLWKFMDYLNRVMPIWLSYSP